MWAMLAGWVVREKMTGLGSQALGSWRGWRGLVHIKGVVMLAAGMAPPFPAQWGFAL